jgi:hypothetical protein
MKLESTLENKAKFFAQYWGTKTMYVGGVGLVEIGKGGWNLKHPDFFLQLTPLSQITDEDAIEIGYDNSEDFKYHFLKWNEVHKTEVIDADLLRSKGYALPWMGLSVDELVEYGWIKLKEV